MVMRKGGYVARRIAGSGLSSEKARVRSKAHFILSHKWAVKFTVI